MSPSEEYESVKAMCKRRREMEREIKLIQMLLFFYPDKEISEIKELAKELMEQT